MYNDWVIPSRRIMDDVQQNIEKYQGIIIDLQSQINDLGIITRSRRNQFEDLTEKVEYNQRMLRSYNNMMDRYTETYRIVRTETEDFGWRYPTWAQWPRDADLFHREATNAYNAKMDIQAFGRVY